MSKYWKYLAIAGIALSLLVSGFLYYQGNDATKVNKNQTRPNSTRIYTR